MIIGTVITLNNGEQEIARLIANMRYEQCRKDNITNAKVGDQSNEQTDLEGFGAEMAFGKGFNIYPDYLIKPKSAFNGEDIDGDCTMHNGHTVDVKSTRHVNGQLICATWKNQEEGPDYYALMTGTFPTYTFRGLLTKNELCRDCNLKELMKGKVCYAVNQIELMNLDELEAAILMGGII